MEAIIDSTNDAVVTNATLTDANSSATLNIPAQVSFSVTAETNETKKDNKVDAIDTLLAMGELEKLVADREHWQDTAYKTSNDMLYGILQRCYAYYDKMGGDSDAAKTARAGFRLYVESRNLTFKKSTHTIAKIVACVFGADRRRVSAYSIALRSALQHKVDTKDLIDYLRGAGGVEELRLAKNPNLMTTKTKAKTATSWLNDYELATVQSELLSQDLDAANVGSQHVLLATQCADGSFKIHGVVSNAGIADATLAAFYTKHKSAKATESAGQEAAGEQADLNTLIAEAAAHTHQ